MESRKGFFVVGIGIAAVAGTFGYLFSKRGQKSPKKKDNLWKMHETTDDDHMLNYIKQHCTPLHPVQTELIDATLAAPEPEMLGSSDELQLLQSMMVTMGGKKTLDIGTYTGYSALTLALALPDDGRVVTCDINEDFVKIGKPFWEKAGVTDKIELRIAPAIQTLDDLIHNGEAGTFDLAFIDADEDNYLNYYERCVKLLRRGGIIAVDNALLNGEVLNPYNNDSDTVWIRTLNDFIVRDDRVIATMLMLGDGTTIAVKK